MKYFSWAPSQLENSSASFSGVSLSRSSLVSTKGPIVKKTVKKEKEEGKEEGEKEENLAKQEVVESKGAKKKVETKPAPKIATKKKERTKSENDSKLKVPPTKARSTSQSRWKTLNNNAPPAKVNKKEENTNRIDFYYVILPSKPHKSMLKVPIWDLDCCWSSMPSFPSLLY